MITDETALTPGETAWRALGYFNVYRLLIAFLFVALYWIGQLPQPLGVYDAKIFSIAAHLYLAFTIFAYYLIHIQNPPYVYQVSLHVLVDVVIITLMMYASAGLNSGFGMLLVITIAAGALLSPRRIAVLYAAIAALAVLGYEGYMQFSGKELEPNYTHAGFLGMTFFLTSLISQTLAARVKATEVLALQRALDVEKLANLNEHIVQRLQSGIIVLNERLQVQLLNQSAKILLGVESADRGGHIEELFPEISGLLHEWNTDIGLQTAMVKPAATRVEVQVSFVSLHTGQGADILIFIDDVSSFNQRAQQLKLASLGRLTASIAHEIRNPLGAISHASQLLIESGAISEEDRRLTHIIEHHTRRVNRIVENVMDISRRHRAVPVALELAKWLEHFRQEFALNHRIDENEIGIPVQQDEVMAKMDPSQLYQVISNLVENALRYSNNSPRALVQCGTTRESQRPYIDVIDSGPGIPAEAIDHLFEPFYTTYAKGTGLGLFIARELCESNQATLSLHGNSDAGCCFRILFSHPDKQHKMM